MADGGGIGNRGGDGKMSLRSGALRLQKKGMKRKNGSRLPLIPRARLKGASKGEATNGRPSDQSGIVPATWLVALGKKD